MRREDLVGAIGLEAALRLTRVAGGKRLWVRAPTLDDPVVRVIGMDAYRRLHDAFASESIDLPSFSSIRAVARRMQAENLLRRGLSVRQVAAETHLSRRGVARIRDAMSGPGG